MSGPRSSTSGVEAGMGAQRDDTIHVTPEAFDEIVSLRRQALDLMYAARQPNRSLAEKLELRRQSRDASARAREIGR